MQRGADSKTARPKQSQRRPGFEKSLKPIPDSKPIEYKNGKLYNKIALITGGDSGIGKATAILFAKEGADVAISFLNEVSDAEDTKLQVESFGRKCLLIKGDISKEKNCKSAVEKCINKFGRLDILINNAAIHWEVENFLDITTEQLTQTFATNIFSYFWITKYALPYLKKGSTIVNTTSVTAYRGTPKLVDYASTKGAIVSFTRSLSSNLISKGIRVNAVAPGPVWTPLIASSLKPKDVAKFGSDVPMARAGETHEIANCFLFLASDDSSYMSGQVLHANGGEIVNG